MCSNTKPALTFWLRKLSTGTGYAQNTQVFTYFCTVHSTIVFCLINKQYSCCIQLLAVSIYFWTKTSAFHKWKLYPFFLHFLTTKSLEMLFSYNTLVLFCTISYCHIFCFTFLPSRRFIFHSNHCGSQFLFSLHIMIIMYSK